MLQFPRWVTFSVNVADFFSFSAPLERSEVNPATDEIFSFTKIVGYLGYSALDSQNVFCVAAVIIFLHSSWRYGFADDKPNQS